MSQRHSLPLYVLACIVLAGTLARCDANGPDPEANRFEADFEAFWNTFDQNYSYFVFKNVDWQQRYETTRPLLDQVTTDDALISVLQDMITPLRDVHIFFRSPDGRQIATYEPARLPNWDRAVWQGYVQQHGWQQQASNWGHARVDSLPYLAIGAWNTSQVKIDEVDQVLALFQNSPGLIFDVRMNGGGNDQLAFQVAGRFTREERLATFFQFRNGPNHDDFTDLTPRTLSPRGPWQFDKPVALLVGRGVFSSNESFVSAMRELPHVTVIGDTTGGSSGNPALFDLSNGWQYAVPRWIAYTADQTIIEWNGIPPDIYVEATPSDFAQGRDPVLEFAVAWLREQLNTASSR